MSVINNVLKGLESRESQFIPIEIAAIESAQAAPVRKKKMPVFAGLLLLLLLAAGAGFYLSNPGAVRTLIETTVIENTPADPLPELPAPVTDEPASSAVTAQPEEPAMSLAASEAPTPNRIVGLQIRETETEMRLEFSLRERVVAFLQERSENSFGYHLRAVESEIVAPIMRNNRWIESLAIVPAGSGVDISFVTAPDILVETRQLQADGESQWVIDLRQPNPAVVEIPPQEKKPLAVSPPQAMAEADSREPAAAVEAAPAEPETTVPQAAQIKLDIKSTNPVSVTADQLEYAVELMNSGRPADAEALLQGMLGGAADYKARQHLLVLYGRSNRSGRLNSLLMSSLREYPRDPLFVTEYARRLFQAASYREVIQLLSQDAALDARQQALLAASHQRLDQHVEAMRHYRLALEQDPGEARSWIGLGISQEQEAVFADALDSYLKAARLGGLNSRLQAFVDRRVKTLTQVVD